MRTNVPTYVFHFYVHQTIGKYNLIKQKAQTFKQSLSFRIY